MTNVADPIPQFYNVTQKIKKQNKKKIKKKEKQVLDGFIIKNIDTYTSWNKQHSFSTSFVLYKVSLI